MLFRYSCAQFGLADGILKYIVRVTQWQIVCMELMGIPELEWSRFKGPILVYRIFNVI